MESLLNSSTLIFLFVAVYIIESVSELLNLQTSKNPLPNELSDLQTPEQQARASTYLKDRIKLSLVKDGFFLVLFIALLKTGFFAYLQYFVINHFDQPLAQALIFVAVLGFGQAILGIPFSLISTFKIESKYGFNRTTAGTFIGDLVKGGIIGAIIGGLLFSFIVEMLQHFGDHAWLAMWIGYTAFQFFLVWIAPVALLPLFLKLSELDSGPLKQSIEEYSQKQNFKLNGVWVCDASKRSAKSNAFFTGFGRFRRLVLFDTLIEKHPPAEIVAVVAHEAGHFKLGHIWKTSLFSTLSSLVFFYIVQKLIEEPALYQSFDLNAVNNLGIGLVLAVIVISKVLFFVSPVRAYMSRRNEFAADRFSVDTTGDALSLMNGLKRLVTENLATIQHHPLYVILHDSHPPLPDRIKPLLRRT